MSNNRFCCLFRILFLFIVFGVLYNPFLMAMNVDQKEKKSKTIYEQLSDYYLPSLAQEAMAENEESEKRKKYYEAVEKNKLPNNETSINQIKDMFALSEYNKIVSGYASLNALNKKNEDTNQQLDASVVNDLKLFCGKNNALKKHVFAVLDNTETVFGKIELQKILLSPLTNKKELENRQLFIKKLIEDEKFFDIVQALIQKIKTVEIDTIWFWATFSDVIKIIISYRNLGFVGRSFMTSMAVVLMIWPFIFVAMIVVEEANFSRISFLQEYSLILKNFGEFCKWVIFDNAIMGRDGGHLFGLVLSTFIGMGAFTYLASVNLGKYVLLDNYNLDMAFQTKMINIAMYLNIIEGLGKFIEQKKPEMVGLFPKLGAMTGISSGLSDEAKEFVALLKKDTFKGDASFFSWTGNVTKAFTMMEKTKNNFVEAYQAIGTLDAYLSIAKIYKKSMKNIEKPWCFVEYKYGVMHPQVTLKNYWNPTFGSGDVVTNDIDIGLSQGFGNVIITGPNAGGKSTALKSIALSVILGQTFGIVPAESMILTPFSHIGTYMNIVDTQGEESLFQAEMRRAQSLINRLRNLKPHEFSFVVLDEIFTGTNAKEGAAGAYGVAHNMAHFGNSMALIATHYKQLTKLPETTKGRFKNCKVSVVVHDNGTFTPTYKLTDGISDQEVALQLLDNVGFGADVLNPAHVLLDH